MKAPRNHQIHLLVFLLCFIFIVGCGSNGGNNNDNNGSNNADNNGNDTDQTPIQLGEWSGLADFGQIDFTLTAGNPNLQECTITFLDYTCGNITHNGSITASWGDGIQINDHQINFEITLSYEGSNYIALEGTFSDTGDAVSGEFALYEGSDVCNGTWSASVDSSNSNSEEGEDSVSTDLRKEISFSVVDVSSDFSFGTAYATRPYASTQYIYGIIPITNNSSSETYCFVRLETINYQDSDGNLLYQEDGSYVYGQVQWNGSTIFTNTCLRPGESGHFILIDNNDSDDLYDNTSSIEVDAISISTSGTNWQDPTADVQEQSGGTYTATYSSVPVINNGTESAQLNENSVYILTDSSGEPMTWSFFDSASVSILAAGDTATYTSSTNYNNTGVQGGFSYIDFEDVISYSSPPLYNSTPWPLKSDYYTPEEYKEALNDTKNQREELKQNNF
jgi:hypothetical protein